MSKDNPFKTWLNPDGKTYNGMAMLVDLSGLSEEEVMWTAARLRQLICMEHHTREHALWVVQQEATQRPWMCPNA